MSCATAILSRNPEDHPLLDRFIELRRECDDVEWDAARGDFNKGQALLTYWYESEAGVEFEALRDELYPPA